MCTWWRRSHAPYGRLRAMPRRASVESISRPVTVSAISIRPGSTRSHSITSAGAASSTPISDAIATTPSRVRT